MTNEIKKNMMMDEELDQVTGGSAIVSLLRKAFEDYKAQAVSSTSATSVISSETIATSWI